MHPSGLSRQYPVCIKGSDGDIITSGYLAIQLQGQVTQRADSQEGGKITKIVPSNYGFVIKAGDHLGPVHAIALGDFFQYLPEVVLKPNTGHHAIDAQRVSGADPQVGIGINKEFAHFQTLRA